MGLLAPLPAEAQTAGEPRRDPGREGGGNGRSRQGQFAEAWKTADKDGDGFISRAEFDAMPRISNLPEEKRPRIFDRLDKNDDGRLGRDELKRQGRPQDGQRPPMPRIWELDTDKNGGVSLEEFKAGHMFQKLPPEKQMAIFQRLDADGDGLLTPKDRPQPPYKPEDGKHRSRRGPETGKGPGKAAEARPEPQRMIRQLDQDGDGALSFEEFRAGPALRLLGEDEQEDRFETLDKNGDQKITSEDFPPAPPRGEPERPAPSPSR